MMLRNYFLLIAVTMLFISARFPACSQDNGKPKRTLLWTLDWSPDDKYIAFGGDDSVLWIIKTADMSLYKSIKMGNMIRKAVWNPTDPRILLVSTRDYAHLLDIETEKRTTLPGTAGARGMAWRSDGSMLVTATSTANVWTRGGRHVSKLKKQHDKSLFGADWHPSQDVIVTSGDEIMLFETTGKQLNMFRHRSEPTGILSVAWHPSGEFFATGDYGNDGVESIVQFWKADGKLLKTLHGSKIEYRNIVWSRDGKYLATASDVLRIWSSDGELLTTGNRNSDNLWGIDWDSKGERIATASADGAVMIWSRDGKLLKSFD